MNILVTGARGFVGKNLCASLENIRDGKDKTRPDLSIGEIFSYDLDTDPSCLEDFCARADFVFHLAGVNRPKDPAEFMSGNFGFSSALLETLKKQKNPCPVMLSSSIQASLTGRFASSEYGRSKLAGEEVFLSYAKETGAKVLIYRFPNLFGKWCRPNYNSAVATFCHQIANNLPVTVDDRTTRLELLYIDDLVQEMLDALEGKEHRCGFDGPEILPDEKGRYCFVPVTHQATLEEIVDLLESFRAQPDMLLLPSIAPGSFAKKLYSTYLSYLPEERISFPLQMNRDVRGSFTEVLKTKESGQFSVNISAPGVTKGEHWHHSKWEFFIVVSGHGLIQERKIGTDDNGRPWPVLEFEVSGGNLQAVHMLPGYTHNLINLSETENLVTLMWANELFDPGHPDTYREPVKVDLNHDDGRRRPAEAAGEGEK